MHRPCLRAGLCIEKQVDQFADGSVAASELGDVVGRRPCCFVGIGDRYGKADERKHFAIRGIIADKGRFFTQDTGG